MNADDFLHPDGYLPQSWFPGGSDDVAVWCAKADTLTGDASKAEAYVYFRGYHYRYNELLLSEAAKQKLGDASDEFTQTQLDAIAKERDKWLALCHELVPNETFVLQGSIGGAVLTTLEVC